jgi:protocatechuate 3,4-dioxygenase beta subunit
MRTTLATLVTVLVTLTAIAAQDDRLTRMWTDAQKLKPARVTSTERIAPASEPGIPFVARGMVVDPAGKPLAGVDVFAYQTDSTGIYAPPGAADPWRLKGWAVTDAQGRFEFRTIRPGNYPGNQIAAHIHLSFVAGCCGRQWSEVMFDDDPVATPAYRQRQRTDIMFGKVTRRPDGTQETSYVFRPKPRGDF